MILRSRTGLFVCAILVVCLGLWSRSGLIDATSLIGLYGGDTLWAALVYILFAFLFPDLKPLRLLLMALAFSLLIELSQLLRYDWLLYLRKTTIGSLILGHGFLWSDLVCYSVGITIVFGIDCYLQLHFRRKQTGAL